MFSCLFPSKSMSFFISLLYIFYTPWPLQLGFSHPLAQAASLHPLVPPCTHFFSPQLLPNPTALFLAQHSPPSLPLPAIPVSRGFVSHLSYSSQFPCVFTKSSPGSGSHKPELGIFSLWLPGGMLKPSNESRCRAVSSEPCCRFVILWRWHIES